jgi:hypothetical protein
MMKWTEGLQPWQPKKIYYFTDAFEAFSQYWHDKRVLSPYRKNLVEGNGPEYLNSRLSPSRHVSYGRLAAEGQAFYLRQGGHIGKEALARNDVSAFELPVHFIFGKSLVEGSGTSDIFEGIKPGPIPFTRIPGFEQQTHEGLSVQLDGPWRFYPEFWKAHNLEVMAKLLPVLEVAIPRGGTLRVPLLEAAILRDLERFLLELGSDFSFIARQKRITVDGEDYYLDLLFFHRRLRRLLAVDLKLGRFRAADKGQMELYLRWLEKYERQPGEEPPLGLILCAGKSDEHVELLQLERSGIRIAEYLTELPPREVLERRLHEALRAARERFNHGLEAGSEQK